MEVECLRNLPFAGFTSPTFMSARTSTPNAESSTRFTATSGNGGWYRALPTLSSSQVIWHRAEKLKSTLYSTMSFSGRSWNSLTTAPYGSSQYQGIMTPTKTGIKPSLEKRFLNLVNTTSIQRKRSARDESFSYLGSEPTSQPSRVILRATGWAQPKELSLRAFGCEELTLDSLASTLLGFARTRKIGIASRQALSW